MSRFAETPVTIVRERGIPRECWVEDIHGHAVPLAQAASLSVGHQRSTSRIRFHAADPAAPRFQASGADRARALEEGAPAPT